MIVRDSPAPRARRDVPGLDAHAVTRSSNPRRGGKACGHRLLPTGKQAHALASARRFCRRRCALARQLRLGTRGLWLQKLVSGSATGGLRRVVAVTFDARPHHQTTKRPASGRSFAVNKAFCQRAERPRHGLRHAHSRQRCGVRAPQVPRRASVFYRADGCSCCGVCTRARELEPTA